VVHPIRSSSFFLSNRRLRFGLLFSGVLLTVWLSSELPALATEGNILASFNPQLLLKDSLTWIENQGAIGAIAFIFLYVIATVAFLPGSLLTLGAGFVFDVVPGSILVFVGSTIGATAAFLVGRYLARGWVSKKIAGNQKFASVDKAVGKAGFKIVLLTRLSPFFPFSVLNYAMGLTSVSLKDYVFASIGMLPGTIAYVYFGSLLQDLAQIGTGSQPGNEAVKWIRIIGFIVTAAVTIYVTRVASKALEEEIV
jgi:uncharacterized membrane protein YdjX (TVP38/TMEM64 family)